MYESQLGVLREIVLKKFKVYKEELERKEIKREVAKEKLKHQQEANLTVKETKGLNNLRKRIKEN